MLFRINIPEEDEDEKANPLQKSQEEKARSIKREQKEIYVSKLTSSRYDVIHLVIDPEEY